MTTQNVVNTPNPVGQSGAQLYAADSGAANAYVVTLSPVPATIAAGFTFVFKAANANTTTSTVTVNGQGPFTIKKLVTTDLSANDILANQMVSLTFDGTNMQMNPPPSSGTGSVSSVGTAGLATGGPITSSGTVTVTAATQADQETGTSTTVAVTPGRQQYHISAAKFWLMADTNGNSIASYNIATVTDVGNGQISATYTTNFSTANYAMSADLIFTPALVRIRSCQVTAQSASGFSGECIDETVNYADPSDWFFIGFGDQ